jgi:hypothetical protein
MREDAHGSEADVRHVGNFHNFRDV